MAERTVKVTIRADASNYLKEMDEAARKTNETATAAEKLASKRQAYEQLGRGLMAYGAAVTAIGVAMLKTGVEYNSLQQRTRASLTTMLGSAKAANEQMDKLDAFARTSPFSKQTFIQAQQQMLAFGIESRKVVPYLEAIQDAVAAAGGSNAEIARIVETMSKIQASSKITAQDLNEFGNAGINAAELIGSQMGKTGAQIREDITAGSLDATQALDALAAGMSERFGGAAANVKETFEGAVDRVKAAWRDLSASLAEPLVGSEGGGFLIDVTNKLADFMRMIEGLPQPVKMVAAGLTGLSGAAALAGGAFFLAVPRIAEYNRNLQHMPQLFQRVDAGARAVGRGLKSIGWSPAGLALGALTAAVMIYANEKRKQRQRIDEVKETLDEETGAITENSEAWSRKRLQEEGALDLAEAMGANIGLVTEAAMGEADAYERLVEHLNTLDNARIVHNGKLLSNERATVQLLNVVNQNSDALRRGVEEHEQAARAAELQAGGYGVLTDRGREYRDSALETADASGDVAYGLNETTDAAEEAAKAIDDAVKALKDLGNEFSSAWDAETKFAEAVDSATAAVKKNGATLDEKTEKGRANRNELSRMAQAALDLAAENYNLSGSTEDLTADIETGREAFVRAATQMDATQAEAEALADKFGLTSDAALLAADNAMNAGDGIKNAGQQADTSSGKVKLFTAEIKKIPMNTEPKITAVAVTRTAESDLTRLARPRTVSLMASVVGAGSTTWAPGVSVRAHGGLASYANGRAVEHFGNGGIPTGIYRGGPPIYKFAEPETQWEAFISGKPGQEQRNIQIALEALRRLGYNHDDVHAFDRGGIVSGERYSSHIPRTSNTQGVVAPTINVTATVDEDSARFLAGEMRAGIRDLFGDQSMKFRRESEV